MKDNQNQEPLYHPGRYCTGLNSKIYIKNRTLQCEVKFPFMFIDTEKRIFFSCFMMLQCYTFLLPTWIVITYPNFRYRFERGGERETARVEAGMNS